MGPGSGLELSVYGSARLEDFADRCVVLAQVSADFQQPIPIAQMGLADGPASLFPILLRAPAAVFGGAVLK